MVKTLSQAAIGRALGLSQASRTKLKKKGMPVNSVEAARAWRTERQNIAQRKAEPKPDQELNSIPARASTPVPDSSAGQWPFPDHVPQDLPAAAPDESHDSARTRREIAEANLAEMKEFEQRGELIRVSAVQGQLAIMLATTRDTLLQLAPRLAPLLAADSDPANVQNTLYSEIHQALQHLAGNLDRIGQTEVSTT